MNNQTRALTRRTFTRRDFIKLSAMGASAAALAACGSETPPPPAPTLPPATQVPNPTASAAPALTPAATEAAAATAAVAEAPTAAAAVATPTPTLASDMAQAAQAFFSALDPGQQARANYGFDDSERFRWHWTTPSGFPRNGLPLREMTDGQKTLAHTLLAASISAAGYEKSVNIMTLQNDLGNDPELYFVTIFGAPGDSRWGWRWEGHHLSRQFTIVDGQLALTPLFLGAWPTLSSTGLRAMEREEDAALELVTSIGQAAIFQGNTLTRHITQNDPRVGPLDPVGVLYSDLSAGQQQVVLEIIQTYLSAFPESVAQAQNERVTAAGLENIRFGWAGPTELRRPTYYRLQGPTFLLEHDKSRSGGTHIHSVWRDFEQDFGYHLLA